MVVFAVPLIIAACIFSSYKNKGYSTKYCIGQSSFPFIICLAFSFITIGMTVNGIVSNVTDEIVEVRSTPLSALRNQQSIERSFFLGSGRVEGREYYIGYTKQIGGGIKQVKIPVENTIIFESNTETPRVEYKIHGSNSDWAFMFKRGMRNTEYNIFIPEGSLIQNYEIK